MEQACQEMGLGGWREAAISPLSRAPLSPVHGFMKYLQNLPVKPLFCQKKL